MEHEDFVTYEQAKKLKEFGFDWECNHYYDIETKEFIENHNDYSPEDSFSDCSSYDDHNGCWNCVSAPTLAQTQKWLREIEKTEVIVNRIDEGIYDFTIYGKIKDVTTTRRFDSYDEALSNGIDKALELVK